MAGIATALLSALPSGEPQAEHGDGARMLVRLERDRAHALGHGFERWRMIGARDDTVTGIWRARTLRAARPNAPDWTVVILGGIGTDDQAALLVPDSLPVSVLAVSWPWKGPRQMSQWEFVSNAPAIRAALLRTPPALASGVEAVRQARPGTRVALVGASLGVPPAVAALPLAGADALVLVDGAADLERLLRSEAARALREGSITAKFAQASTPLVARMLEPLEPSRRDAAERDIPTLIVDAEREDRIPSACVAALHARFPHATLARHPGGHLRPEDHRQVNAIVTTVWRWLRDGGAGRSSP